MQNNLRTLPCDDKEKLRRKLALLQREYSRTVQRLKRAERSEALRKHVPSSRTTEKSLGDQCDPTGSPGSSLCPKPVVSHSVLVEAPCETVPPRTPQGQGLTGGPVESQNDHTISGVNFPLVSDSDAVFPLTPDPGGVDPAARGGYRSSPALRLRSRSSRLRWEKRWREDNSEDGLDPSGKTPGGTSGDGEEDRGRRTGEETEVVNSDSESESPSLLLTHWNIAGRCGEVEREQRETGSASGGGKERNSRGRDGPSPLVTHWSPATHVEDEDEESQSGLGGKERMGAGGGGRIGEMLSREGERRNVVVQEEHRGKGIDHNEGEKKTEEDERTNSITVLGKSCEERSCGEEVGGGEEGEQQRGLLLDSCTLVEGLLFPVEYYVRTTRHMSSSRRHSESNIHYQLSPGRRPRGRGPGRGRGRGRAKLVYSQPDGLTASLDDRSSQLESAVNRRSSSDASVSQTSAGSSSSGVQRTAGPTRGRGRRRGRGRGRGKRPSFGRSVSLDAATSLPDQHLLPRVPPPSSSSLLPPPTQPTSSAVDGQEECHLLVSQAALVVPCRTQSPPVPAGQPPCRVDEPMRQGPAASGHVEEKVYPIFTKSRPANEQTPQQFNRASWCSLLLPPQHSVPPPLSPLLPLGPGLRGLENFDLQQDFHLPDEQFASLKLHKLRQVAATEAFSSPSYNTRNSGRRYYGGCTDQPTPFALPLSPTPPVTADPSHPGDGRRRSTQRRSVVDLQSSPSSSPTLDFTDHHQAAAANLSNMVVVGDSSDGSLLISPGEVKDGPSCGAVPTEEHRSSTKHQTQDRSPPNRSLSRCELPPPQQQGCCENPSQTRKDSDLPQDEEAPEPDHLNLSRLTKDTSSSQCLTVDGLGGDSPTLHGHSVECAPPGHHHHTPSQLLLSPSLASLPWGRSLSSLPLPSLGPTPAPLLAAKLPEPEFGGQVMRTDQPPPPLTSSSPSAPLSFSLLSPSTTLPRFPQKPLSFPGPTLNHFPDTPLSPQRSPSSPGCTPFQQEKTSIRRPQGEVHVSSHLPAANNPCQRIVASTSSPPVPSSQPQGSMGTVPLVTSDRGAVGHRQDDKRSQGSSEHHVMACIHTLKRPAGGPLVDACCVWRPPGEEDCVAVAGKWAVCVWEKTSAADWSLINTWTFCEPVINVFAVPDAAGLLCVALGQLEIREVRMLSCSGLSQTLLCNGVVHSVVGVANSRVVSSSPSATGSTLKLFHLLEDGSSAPASQPLAAPGVCVGTLATVDGLSDALIGSAEGGNLFLWNLHSGQLLRQISLGETLSHTVCLNGYSHSGVLFVLLQHQLLNSMEVSDREGGGVLCALDEDEDEERGKKKTVLFSVVAVNPLTGKSLLATQLYQPEAWSGRLCEADIMGSGVVGLSQNGRVCVWELGGGPRSSRHPVWAPEGEGWQLARWGRQDTLLTGHHNGDLTLNRYAANPTATTNHQSD